MNLEIADHKTCVHLFGAASSPKSSNYALRKAATDSHDRQELLWKSRCCSNNEELSRELTAQIS